MEIVSLRLLFLNVRIGRPSNRLASEAGGLPETRERDCREALESFLLETRLHTCGLSSRWELEDAAIYNNRLELDSIFQFALIV